MPMLTKKCMPGIGGGGSAWFGPGICFVVNKTKMASYGSIFLWLCDQLSSNFACFTKLGIMVNIIDPWTKLVSLLYENYKNLWTLRDIKNVQSRGHYSPGFFTRQMFELHVKHNVCIVLSFQSALHNIWKKCSFVQRLTCKSHLTGLY